MTPQELRNSILQLAIQGKLVEQRPEEGTGEELYQAIQKERESFIKDGKAKKSKTLSEIAEDEMPFDIPDNWRWARLGHCGTFVRGSGIKRSETVPKGFPCVRYGQLYTTYKTSFSSAVSFIPKDLFDRCQKVHNTDILMALTGENKFDIALAVAYEGTEEVAMGGDMTKFSNHLMETLFLVYVINSPYGISCKSKLATGNIIVHISNDKLGSIPIPIPPRDEQKRIVAKIEELMPLVEQYEEAWNRLEELNKRFPTDLQKSILQYAIQGKLVEQRPEEGTGEKLYQCIQKEKQLLINNGLLKKTKRLSDIDEDEIPFEIPKNWIWARLGEVASTTGGYAFKSSDYTLTGTRVLRISDFNEKGFVDTNIVRHPYDESFKDYLLQENDILLCMTGGTVGKSYYVETLNEPMLVNQRVATIRSSGVSSKYLYINICAPLIGEIIMSSKNSTNDNISMATILSFLIPLPPLQEQKRIVESVEELLLLCDRMRL